ncbi:MAG: RagB/SusD family nutrient uptake outer membrane protein [Cyclobacteriaceae bacterium]|nr:RagB/SusD family nutrient uptake outer membrane protein [Cyclobacteriaceae bacterium]
MKPLNIKIQIYLLVFSVFFACNEDEILREVPLDFASPENSYITPADFTSAVNALYDQARFALSDGEKRPMDYLYATDLGYNGANQLNEYFGSYQATLLPTSEQALFPWKTYYGIISMSNVILNRLDNSALTGSQKILVEAQAKLFRGLAYRNLAHLYGGVPIELNEVRSPKTDYVRASRTEVYEQAKSDLEFAAANLPGIAQVRDGEISNLAAYHILAEVYVTLKKWNDAIQAATVVINDPSTALMTQRFGSLANEPGDVYWDLSRRYNQNRGSGNTEGIWVWQYEVDLPGGSTFSSTLAGPQLERDHAPFTWGFSVRDPSGVTPFLNLGVSDNTGGRGIGRFRGTNHLNYGIWEYDWNDMRNSQYNMVRDVKFNNPASEWYGRYISEFMSRFRQNRDDTIRRFYPYQAKVTTPGQHPPELFVDPILKTLNAAAAGTTYSDQYHIRLAETYLLRAEAHLGNGNLAEAANDINVIRTRANAKLVTAGEIDIDFILDERMRELGVEEKRRLTLNRLELLYDRTLRYCEGKPGIAPRAAGVQPHNNLYPIPFSEIERNTGAVLAQNPGYAAE